MEPINAQCGNVGGGGSPSASVIAHRGFAGEYPENTLLAVMNASLDADAIEIDVRRCKTGELVVYHDELLDRLTDATGLVAETPFERIRELTVDGEPIPTVEQVFAAVPDDTDLYVHLKADGIAEEIARDDVVYTSESMETLQNVPDGLTTAYAVRSPVDVETVAAMGCDELHPHKDVVRETDIVEQARDVGLDVVTWTIRSEDEYEELREDVDGMHMDIIPAD